MQVQRSMWLTILWGWLAFTPPLAFAQKKRVSLAICRIAWSSASEIAP